MDKKKWSKFVSNARTNSGMTLHEFGESIGTSWVTIWRWENEYVMPRKEAIEYWEREINKYDY